MIPGLAAALVLAGAEPVVEHVVQPDGLELVSVTIPSARCAIRVVVRAGGADDPKGKAGLAHLVEHLSFDDRDGTALMSVMEEGVNAFTSAYMTVFHADAPAGVCGERLELILSAVSRGGFRRSWLERERNVIVREATYSGGARGFIESGLFPTVNVLGTPATRDAITLQDTLQFFRRHYTPASTTVVVVGPVGLAGVAAAVHAAYLAPPERPDERYTPEVPRMRAPQKGIEVYGDTFGDFEGWAAVVAEVPEAEAALCVSAAELLELRMRRELGQADAAACFRLHGHLLLATTALVPSPETARLALERRVLSMLMRRLEVLASTQFVGQEIDRLEREHQRFLTRGELDHVVDAINQARLRLKGILAEQQKVVDALEGSVVARREQFRRVLDRMEALWASPAASASDAGRLARRRGHMGAWYLVRPSQLADELAQRTSGAEMAAHAERLLGSTEQAEPKRLGRFIASLKRGTLLGR